ncbi:patatin-like phospholipase family protein [Aeromonas jandaei]|uniref:patatin-like phospholipase family protein n=1 Tax=Aeromonas jandaei TaxID=650 RepID=UPI001115FEDE|nr:patatin-like phospholipase family protein [Aeromonas jandaei]TNH92815.1 hypothetical protein CF104_21860 [Aeromonas jandaei]
MKINQNQINQIINTNITRSGTQVAKVNGIEYSVTFDTHGKAIEAHRAQENTGLIYTLKKHICAFFHCRTSDDLLKVLNSNKTISSQEKLGFNVYPEKTTAANKIYDSICFSGGGAKGFAYAGILKSLGERLEYVNEVSGASAGAITATFVAAGLNANDISEIMAGQAPEFNQRAISTQIKTGLTRKLNDHKDEIVKFLRQNNNPIKQANGLPYPEGCNSQDIDLSEITFSQLELLKNSDLNKRLNLKTLLLTSTLFNKKDNMASEVLMSEGTTPDFPIWKAAMASASLPIKLPPVEVKNKDFFNGALYGENEPDKIIYLRDGGLRNNLPVRYLTGDSKLVLTFDDSDGIQNRGLNFTEKLKNKLSGDKPYIYRKADIHSANCDPKSTVYYIKPGCSTTQINKAVKNFYPTRERVAMEFNSFEKMDHAKKETSAASDREMNKMKYGPNRWGIEPLPNLTGN